LLVRKFGQQLKSQAASISSQRNNHRE
jgi:hypothetical protein